MKDISYRLEKRIEGLGGGWCLTKSVSDGNTTTETHIGIIQKRNDDGLWEAWQIGAKYPDGPGRKTRKECRELLINRDKAPTREESIAAELAKIHGPAPAVGPEREDCRCAARIRGSEHRNIHDLYPLGECPDDCHQNYVHVETGTKFNQFDISRLAAAVVDACRFKGTAPTQYVELMNVWCKVTGLPARSALMVAAEIHNRPTPTIAIAAPF